MKNFKILALPLAFWLCVLPACKNTPEAELPPVQKLGGFETNDVPLLTAFETTTSSAYTVVSDFINSSAYSSFLSQNSFSASNYYRLQADDKYYFYGIKLNKSETTSGKEYYLVLYPENNSVNPIIFEQEDNDGYFNISLFEMGNYSPIASGNFIDGGTGPVEYINCDDTTSNFNDCMDCAFDVLTDDWVSTAACMVAPWSCIAAAIIHCM